MQTISTEERNILDNCLDLEQELKELMAEMDEGERLALARARGLPLFIYEVLAGDDCDAVRLATLANIDSPFV